MKVVAFLLEIEATCPLNSHQAERVMKNHWCEM